MTRRKREVMNEAVEILHRDLLRVRLPGLRDFGGGGPACIVRDDPIPPGEELHLRVPASAVSGELMDEHQGDPTPVLFVVEPHSVDPSLGHAPTYFETGGLGDDRRPSLPAGCRNVRRLTPRSREI